MIQKLLLLAASLLLAACPGAPPESGREDAPAQPAQVRQALQARLDAVVAGDVEALDGMLAPEFRYIDIWGTVQQRAAYLEGKRTSMNTAEDHWIGQEIEDAEINFIGTDVALATLRVRDHFVYRGVEYVNPVRSSYVLRRMDGRWRFALGHTTSIAPEEE